MENMSKEQIEKNREKIIHDYKQKVTIYFTDKGMGIDTSETGVSRKQLFQAMLGLCKLFSADDWESFISMIEDYDKSVKVVQEITEKLKGALEENNGVQE